MKRAERERFDELLEAVLARVPAAIRALLDEAPLVVEDRPDRQLLADLGMDPRHDVLCGLHSGTPLTERSHADGFDEPEFIFLFREGIVEEAGGWGDETQVVHEIRVTLLHEIGHHFGLEEDDLEALGYD